jgi:hypothetical protein
MVVYTYSEARQNLAALLEKAFREGEVRILRKDGQVFVIRPESRRDSPLSVRSVDVDLTVAEIIDYIREGRRNIS